MLWAPREVCVWLSYFAISKTGRKWPLFGFSWITFAYSHQSEFFFLVWARYACYCMSSDSRPVWTYGTCRTRCTWILGFGDVSLKPYGITHTLECPYTIVHHESIPKWPDMDLDSSYSLSYGTSKFWQRFGTLKRHYSRPRPIQWSRPTSLGWDEQELSNERTRMQNGCVEAGKNNQHVDFPGGHPPEYYPRLSLVNFIERTGYGSLRLIWPIIPTTSDYCTVY